MKITVHCGTDQIGGCVTEYESNGRKLFVDYGEQLPGVPMPDKLFEIEGLTCGDLSKSALLITHYHGDHIGRIAELPPELPIFMGKISKEIALERLGHMSSVNEQQHSINSDSELQNPPYGILDFDDDINYGSEEMVEMLPALNLGAHLFGHIHAQHGVKTINGTVFSNGAVMNCDYTNLHIPNLIEIQNAETQTTSSR